MTLVEQRDEVVPLIAACDALDVSRASLYRARHPHTPSQNVRQRAPSPRRLDEVERRRLLDTMHLPEFADQPPTEVYASLLGRGVYLASIRTMYRVLAEAGETGERRNQRAPHVYTKPSLTATAPNQVWTWDITKLATTQKGVFLMAYVIIDLFSRYVVGWMLAAKECKHLAAQLFAETIARHGVEPGPGSVLGDIIRSGVADVVRLRHIFRQVHESLIVVNAHRVNAGVMPETPPEGSLADFFLIERKEPEEIAATIRTLVKERIPHRFGLDPVDDIQVLTPMHRGLLGAATLNTELQALLNPSGEFGDARGPDAAGRRQGDADPQQLRPLGLQRGHRPPS